MRVNCCCMYSEAISGVSSVAKMAASSAKVPIVVCGDFLV